MYDANVTFVAEIETKESLCSEKILCTINR